MNSNNEDVCEDDVYDDSNIRSDIDTEAVAWAYKKLLAYGVGNTTADNGMMLDRLNAMLQGY
jgi:hypothetical protein